MHMDANRCRQISMHFCHNSRVTYNRTRRVLIRTIYPLACLRVRGHLCSLRSCTKYARPPCMWYLSVVCRCWTYTRCTCTNSIDICTPQSSPSSLSFHTRNFCVASKSITHNSHQPTSQYTPNAHSRPEPTYFALNALQCTARRAYTTHTM